MSMEEHAEYKQTLYANDLVWWYLDIVQRHAMGEQITLQDLITIRDTIAEESERVVSSARLIILVNYMKKFLMERMRHANTETQDSNNKEENITSY